MPTTLWNKVLTHYNGTKHTESGTEVSSLGHKLPQSDLASGGHNQKKKNNPKAQGFATVAAKSTCLKQGAYKHQSPGLCPAHCNCSLLTACQGIEQCCQYPFVSNSQNQTEGVMECHKVPLYSPVMCIPAARVTPACLPRSYVSWSYPSLTADLRQPLVCIFKFMKALRKYHTLYHYLHY